MNPTLKSILLVIITLTISACNNTKTDTTIDNSHGTVDKNVTIKSLTLKSNATTVNVAEHIELSVIGTYLDGSNKAINKNITYTITPKDSAEINNTTVTYSAQDKAGNEANITRSVNVVLPADTTPPLLTLNGEANITMIKDTNYTELGATAIDERDGNVSVSVSGTVDTGTIGNYTVMYTAQDSAGNEVNITRRVEVINATLMLSSIRLESNANMVNVGEMVQLSVMGTYSDGSHSTVDKNITYTVIPAENAEINNNILTAKKDGNVTVQATVGGVKSNSITLSITGRTNSYVLPPEPDPAVNNTTLLGVDVNGNGVRDDVERAIYKKFPKEIRRQLLMQRAKSDQSMMADDEAINNAQKWQKIIANKNIACAKYLFRKYDIDFNLEADDYMDNIQYNTKDRVFKYMRYNHALGGGVYFTPESIVNESSCEFNVTQALKAQ